jgi:hypothetical protein
MPVLGDRPIRNQKKGVEAVDFGITAEQKVLLQRVDRLVKEMRERRFQYSRVLLPLL